MMNVDQKRTDLGLDVMLSLELFTSKSPRNVLTVHEDGRATFQPGFGSHQIELNLDLGTTSTVEEYLRSHLPVEAFLLLTGHYYEIPSPREGGTAAHLYLRSGTREHWVGIGNYGGEEIPTNVDANMFKAVLKLAEYLTEG